MVHFLRNDETSVRNLKWILTCFEMMSRIRINYHNSELIPINIVDEGVLQMYSDVFGCPVRVFSIKYLGIPLHYQKVR
jgi:hypothetical protein